MTPQAAAALQPGDKVHWTSRRKKITAMQTIIELQSHEGLVESVAVPLVTVRLGDGSSRVVSCNVLVK